MPDSQQPHHSADGGASDSSRPRGDSVPLQRPKFNIFGRGPGEDGSRRAAPLSPQIQSTQAAAASGAAAVPSPFKAAPQQGQQSVPLAQPAQSTIAQPAQAPASPQKAPSQPSKSVAVQSPPPANAVFRAKGAPTATAPAQSTTNGGNQTRPVPPSSGVTAPIPATPAATERPRPVSQSATPGPQAKPESGPKPAPQPVKQPEADPDRKAPVLASTHAPISSAGIPKTTPRVTLSRAGSTSENSREENSTSEKSVSWQKIPEFLPFGLVLFDSQQNVVHTNHAHREMLGVDAAEFSSMESWFERVCPNADYAARVLNSWREHVWRKQLTRTFSLKGADHKLREVEFSARLMDDGGLLLTQMDVTEQRRSESQLRMGEKKFRAVFQNEPGGLVLVDRAGGILDANPAFERISGKPVAQLRQTTLTDLLVPQDGLRVLSAEEKLAANPSSRGQETSSVEVRFREDGSSPVNLPPRRMTLCPIRDDDGKMRLALYFVEIPKVEPAKPEPAPAPVAEPVAQSKQDEQLRKSHQQNMALLNVLPGMIFLLDQSLKIADVAPPQGDWTGRAPDGNWKHSLVEAVWPEFAIAITSHAKTIFSGKIVRDVTFESDGGWFGLSAAPCGSDRILVTVEDRTKYQQEEVEPGDHWMEAAFGAVSDAIFKTDLRGIIKEVNPASLEVFGYSESQLVGRGVSRLYSHDESGSNRFNKKLSRSLNKNGVWNGRCEFFRKDGTRGVAEVNFSAVKEDGNPVALAVVHRELKAEKEKKEHHLPVASQASGHRAPAGMEHEQMQHRFRNQLQMVTSLFALEHDEEKESGGSANTGDRWQVRLRAMAQAHSHLHPQDDTVWIVPLIRSISDEAAAVAGRGPGRREVVVHGSDSFRIDAEMATAFSLMVGEIVRLALQKKVHSEGPGIFLKLERKSSSELSLVASSGSGGALFENANESALSSLKNLVQQLRGRMQLTQAGGSQALNVIISSGVKLGEGA